MVGDSAADIGCAKAAGVASILLRSGYSLMDPDSLGADAVVSSLSDIPACLAGIARAKAETKAVS
jgi:phosphoglycolate phosphatase